MLNKDRVIKDLGLIPFGQQGWFYYKGLECPICGKSDKVGIAFNDKGGVIHCFKCQSSQSIYIYLKSIGKAYLLDYNIENDITYKLEDLISNLSLNEVEMKEMVLPYGCKRIYKDKYLEDRNFNEFHYDLFKPCTTNKDFRLKDYIIFQLFQKHELVAWLARSKKSKEWHKDNLHKFKEGKGSLCLRYRNSETIFENILGGYDEITDNTKALFLVEGLFDKVGTDNNLKLNEREDIKCCFTFGNKISKQQIKLIRETNVKKIYLMYDPGTIQQMRNYGIELSQYFNTYIIEILSRNKDPGDISRKELLRYIKDAKTAIEFYLKKIE